MPRARSPPRMPVWGWSSSQTCRIDWLSCTRHCRSSCTYSVRDLCSHCYYDSHRRHHRNRTEQHRKLGILKHYYLDKFNQTGVFICHKRGMWNSIAIEDRREGSLPLIDPYYLLPCPLLSLDCSEKGLNAAQAGIPWSNFCTPSIQLDEVGHYIHDQHLGACATLVYHQWYGASLGE